MKTQNNIASESNTNNFAKLESGFKFSSKIEITKKIINQAKKLGYIGNNTDGDILDFFYLNSDKIKNYEDEADVHNSGSNQNVCYFDYECDGEIVNYSFKYLSQPEGTKMYHSQILFVNKNGLICNMNLFEKVGITEYNQETILNEI